MGTLYWGAWDEETFAESDFDEQTLCDSKCHAGHLGMGDQGSRFQDEHAVGVQ